jgi:hypothetical protein
MNRTFLTEQTGGCPQLEPSSDCTPPALQTTIGSPHPIPAALTALITLSDLRLSQIWDENSPLMGREPGGATVTQCLIQSSDLKNPPQDLF